MASVRRTGLPDIATPPIDTLTRPCERGRVRGLWRQ